MAVTPTPTAIDKIDDPEKIRVTLYASNQPVHAPLVEAVEAGAVGRLLPKGGSEGDVLTKDSDGNFDVKWSKAIGPRAWVNFDGGAASIREDFDVDRITRNAAGDYTVHYSKSMSAAASVTVTAGDTGTPAVYVVNLVALTTASVRFQVRNGSGALIDVDTVCVSVFGIEHNFLILEGDMQVDGLDKILLEGDAAPGVLMTEPSTV